MSWKDIAKSVYNQVIVRPVTYYRDNYGDCGYNDLIYQHLFLRELKGYGVEDVFAPVGGAASYSLLYHILRSLACLKSAQVLEFGAGQSSLLLSACKGKVFEGDILTIEQDGRWAEAISSRVFHHVYHAPIYTTRFGSSATVKYGELKSCIGEQKFNLVIVDGPTGSKKFSRSNILDYVKNLSRDRFIIIFDDTNRYGEKQTLGVLSKALRGEFGSITEYTIRGSTHQSIIMHGVDLHQIYLP